MKTIIALTALLACNVIGSAALVTVRNLPKRDPGQVNNLPSNDKDCKGDVFTPDDIEAAIKVAWQARKDGKFGKDGYKWAGLKKPEKKQGYPHTYTPAQGKQTYEDFNLDGCAQESDDREKKNFFMEFPIKTGGWDWEDLSDDGAQGNHRVVFQYMDDEDDTAAFCGIITHSRPPHHPDFALCPDKSESKVQPADPPAAPNCAPEPEGSVKDSHENHVRWAAEFFCAEYGQGTVADATVNVEATVVSGLWGGFSQGRRPRLWEPENESDDNPDDVYDFSIKSVADCTPDGDFNLDTPVRGHQCPDILFKAWRECNNQGRGGSVMAGCLNYSVLTKF